jgi:ABC-type branched-subunit amino acid transport system substrate-binding protein
VLPDPGAVMSGDQIAGYSALEFRDPGLYSVAGYSGVEVLVRTLQEASSWDATEAGQAARDMSVDTLIGNVSYNSSGALAKPRVYFFQVSGGQYGQVLASVVR